MSATGPDHSEPPLQVETQKKEVTTPLPSYWEWLAGPKPVLKAKQGSSTVELEEASELLNEEHKMAAGSRPGTSGVGRVRKEPPLPGPVLCEAGCGKTFAERKNMTRHRKEHCSAARRKEGEEGS